jgi:hypothetical protein
MGDTKETKSIYYDENGKIVNDYYACAYTMYSC